MTVYVGLESLYSADVGIGVPRLFDYGVRARTLWSEVGECGGLDWCHLATSRLAVDTSLARLCRPVARDSHHFWVTR